MGTTQRLGEKAIFQGTLKKLSWELKTWDIPLDCPMCAIHADLQKLNAEGVELAEIKDGDMPVRK